MSIGARMKKRYNSGRKKRELWLRPRAIGEKGRKGKRVESKLLDT